MTDVKVEVFCFNNGNTAVFRNGEQVPEAQVPWVKMVAANLSKCGIDPVKALVWLPNGERAEFFRTSEEELNWRIVSD